jgi:3-oxoacyl-[acyl-carrier protein] reductase
MCWSTTRVRLVARRTLPEADDAFWAEVMSLNLDSTRRVTRAAAPHLIAAAKTGGASIVNLSSLAGRKGGHPGSLVYSTAKGAILTFTRALANELGPQGVRVNAIAPGMILGTSFHNTHTTPESAKATVAGIPLGRGGNADDVARAAVFLASEYDGLHYRRNTRYQRRSLRRLNWKDSDKSGLALHSARMPHAERA